MIPELTAGAEAVSPWFEIDQQRIAVNYGVNRVRFPAPVPAGSRVRAAFSVEDVEEVGGGARARIAAAVEREGGDEPDCIAELLLRYLQ